MKRVNIRNAVAAAIMAGTTLLGTTLPATAQTGSSGRAYGMGPGMMGAYGMGPGMMGGYGMGPGMMGPWMMGLGMMNGYGLGYHMGPGMMQGYGPGYGMGPGMMGGGIGYGMLYQLNLAPEQWRKVNAVYEELAKRNWEIAGKRREEAYKLSSLVYGEKRDRAAVTNQFRKLQELGAQSFEAQLDARDKVEAVLTSEQKERLRQLAPWWGPQPE